MIIRILIIFCLFIVLNVLACEKDTTGISEDCSPYSGFTAVDHLGNWGTTDSDDWKESELIKSPIAYPNTAIASCNIKFGLTSEAFITITINQKPNQA